MRNIKFIGLVLCAAISTCAFAQTTNTGDYSTQVISADGKTSTWTFILPSSQVTVPASGATDNGIIYEPSGSSKMKFSSSNQFSWQGESSGYIPVPTGGAGTISMTTKGQSDSRYLQLYVNGTAAEETKRLYSKASDDGNITSNGKKGPQSFSFTAADLTTKNGNTYLHFKDNNTEMKIATFKIVLTTGSYSSGGGSEPSSDPIPVTAIGLNDVSVAVGSTANLTVTYTPNNATTGKTITSWSSDNTAVATVSNGVVTGVSAGTATITATTEQGISNTCTVTVTSTPTPPVPSSDLTIHVPEVYEAKDIAGGYGGTLRVVDGREYEVYYPGKTNSTSYASVCIKPNTQKQDGITNNTSATYTEAKDGWFKGNIASISNYNLAENAEFEAGSSNVMHKMANDNAYKFHVQGYDQFSIIAKDKKLDTTGDHSKPQNDQLFEVYIDDVIQPRQSNASSATIRRYTLTSGRHLIEVRAINSGNSELYGFSLRLAQEPRTKWLSGNDSTQVILQTTAPKPVYYATKYNNIPNAETVLEWIGAEATGIGLTKIDGTLTDTLVLSGNANCTTGVYHYAVVAKYNGVETSRAEGSFTVKSDIKATTDINATVFNNEEMDLIKFKYYALNDSAVQLTWPNGKPTGIGGSGSNGTYTISGTPNVSGTLPQDFIYQITVTGADTTITGKITVKELVHTEKDVLYLYKNTYSTPIYDYIKAQGWNPIERKALDNLRGSDQYSYYKWALISEDVDADNGEILALSQGKGRLPVLSMKSFSYTPGRLNWGEPDNGSLTENGRYITVQRDDHPIFKAMNKKRGDSIQVLDTVAGKGLMPIDVYYTGTLCLATALTRDIEDYYGDGYQQTLLHEVPAEINFNQKYICLPIGMEGCKHLSKDGKKLLNECIKYITSTQPTIYVPSTAITTFQIGNYRTDFSREAEGIITIHVPASDSALMKAATPQIELADPMTFVTPASGEAVDFTNWHYGVRYMVSDYINKRYYDIIVRLFDPEGIENIEAGTWVNIFDIFGRKVTTTNEDLRTIDLPSGMYIVVTEDGQTIKTMR